MVRCSKKFHMACTKELGYNNATMSKQSRIERIVEAQKDKKVVLAELAAIGLMAAFRKRIWEDMGAIMNVNHDAQLDNEGSSEATAPWAGIYSARVAPLLERLEEAKDTDQYEALLRLKERLESMGGTAANALAQIRPFKMGEVPREEGEDIKEIAGTLYSVRSESADGEPIVVEEIDVDRAHNLDDDSAINRLREAVRQLIERD